MYIYIYMLLVSIFFASILMQFKENSKFDNYTNIKSIKIKCKYVEGGLLFLSMLPVILLSGFRFSVGCDYFYTYIPIYEQVEQGLSMSKVGTEPLFFLLNKIIVLLGGGTVWLFFITTAIIIALFWIAFYQQSKNLVVSIILFFCIESFFISMAYVRQFISLAIVFYCFKYIKDNKFIYYIIGAIIAGLFHTSAFIFIPIYILSYIKITPAILTSLIVAFSALNDIIINILTEIISKTRYAVYYGTIFQPTYRVYTTKLLVYILVFILASFFYKRNKNDRYFRFLFNLNAIIIFLAANFNLAPLIDRLMFSFDLVIILLIPIILSQCENKWVRQVILTTIIAAFSIVTYHNIVVLNAYEVLPYRFVFAPNMVIL